MAAEGWYVDGTPLEDYTRAITTRGGWDDTPEVRGDDVTLLGRHGVAARRRRYGAGKKTLTMAVLGVSPDDQIPDTGTEQRRRYEENLDALIRLVCDLDRTILVERVHADGSRRQAECQVLNPITPELAGNWLGRIQVELHVPGAFWEDVDPTSHRLDYDTTAGGSQSVEAYSLAGQTAPCADPVVVITGPATAATVRDAVTGSGFTWTGTLLAGQTLTVDAGAFTAVLDDGTPASVLTDLVTYDGQLLEIRRAPSATRGPSLTMSLTGATLASSVVLVTRRKWLR